MKTTEVNKKIIGRRCKCIFTGLLVTGVIEDSSCDFPSYLSFPHGLLEMKRGYSSCPVIFYIQKVNAQS